MVRYDALSVTLKFSVLAVIGISAGFYLFDDNPGAVTSDQALTDRIATGSENQQYRYRADDNIYPDYALSDNATSDSESLTKAVTNPFDTNRSLAGGNSVPGADQLPNGQAVEDSTIVFEQWLQETFKQVPDKVERRTDSQSIAVRDAVANPSTDNNIRQGSDASPASGTALATALDLRVEQIDLPDLTISGQVTTTGGSPVAGLLVQASAPGRASAETRSREDGRFTIDGLEAADYRLVVDGGDQYTGARMWQRAGESGAVLIVSRVSYKMVSGIVADRYGTPVADATVLPPYGGEPATTAADGYFILPVDRSAGGVLLRYRAAGFLETTRHITGGDWLQTDTPDGSIQLHESGIVRAVGKVLDDRYLPVVNAHVEVSSRSPAFRVSTKTDEQGDFILTDIRATQTADFSVKAGNQYQSYHRNQISLHEDTQFQVSLTSKALSSLTAKITGTDGSPLPQMAFLATNLTQRSATMYGASDASGRLEIININPGTFKLRSAARSPSIRVHGLVVDAQQSGTPPEIVVDVGPYRLQGQLMDTRGNPVANAELQMVHILEREGIETQTIRKTTSATDGRFAFGGLGPGPRDIAVAAGDLGEMRFVADPAGGINGVVVVR